MPQILALAIAPLLTAVAGEVVATGTILGTSMTLTGLLSNAVFFGGLFGAEMLLAHPKQAVPSWKLPAGPVTFSPDGQAISARFGSYGRVQIEGVKFFWECDGQTLGIGSVLDTAPWDAIEAYYVDDEFVSVSTGAVLHQTTTPLGQYAVISFDEGTGVLWPQSPSKKWVQFYGYVYVSGQQIPIIIGSGPAGFLEYRNATDAGFSPKLLNTYFGANSPTALAPNGAPLWSTNQHLCRGLTTLSSTWKRFAIAGGGFNVFPNFFPRIKVTGRGRRVWDPRDRTQSFYSPTTGLYDRYNPTWQWSANAALAILAYLSDPEYFALPLSRFNLEYWIQAANDCDAKTPAYAGSTEPFAECHFTFAADQEKRDVLTTLKANCDADVWEDEKGLICIKIGQWEDPEVWLTSSDIAGFSEAPANDAYAEQNVVTASYVEPRLNFVKTPCQEWVDEASVAAVGRRAAAIDFPACHSFSQAFRLAARAQKRLNTPSKITVYTGPRGWLAWNKRVIGINCPQWGLYGVYRLAEPVKQIDLANYELSLLEVTTSMFTDEVPTADPINSSLPGVTNLSTFTPIQPDTPICVVTSAEPNSYITASVTAPNAMARNPFIPEIQYDDTTSIANFHMREVDASHNVLPGQSWALWTTALGQYSRRSDNIHDDTPVPGVATVRYFEVQAWFISAQGTPGAFSASVFVTVTFPIT